MAQLSSKIILRIRDIRAVAAWIGSIEVTDGTPIILEISNTGIGQTLEAKIELQEGQGVWKDLTNYDEW